MAGRKRSQVDESAHPRAFRQKREREAARRLAVEMVLERCFSVEERALLSLEFDRAGCAPWVWIRNVILFTLRQSYLLPTGESEEG